MTEETFRWVITGGVLLAALCFVVQAVVLVVLLRIVSKFSPKIHSLINKAEPIVISSRQILEELRPKITTISADAVQIVGRAKEISVQAKDISGVARDKAHEISGFITDVVERAKKKVAQVDHAVDETVDQVENAKTAVRGAVLRPVREAEGVWAGLKAGIAAYARGSRPSVDHATQDEEMFI